MIFDIKNNEVSQELKATWDTGNSREDILFGSSNIGVTENICDNYYSMTNDPCDVPDVSDRFSVSGQIQSSTKDVLSNSNNIPIYFTQNIGTNALVANFLFSYIYKIHLPKPFQRINN
jgi:hypothetical protein